MSFQYIHTSAKRGLEPGKSGFCCVARDRDLPPDLIAELESQSRYQTSAKGPSPVVLRHRVASLRSGNYHVLSRIQEAGADYSKRNNHLAHHLAFADSELPGLPNPAAILLGWRQWRSLWDEPPRILERSEAFDLQQIDSAWTRHDPLAQFPNVIKNGAPYAFVFRISMHDERPLIEHLRQSLNTLPTRERWDYPFTSCLLPTDRPQDYVWSALLPNLSLPYEVDLTPRPLPRKGPTPAKTLKLRRPEDDSPAPLEQTARESRYRAPVVEIPETYDPRKRKRPKRKFGKREFSRSINIAIALGALVCAALVAFFYQIHKSNPLAGHGPSAPPNGPSSFSTHRRLWQQFEDRGYPLSELEAIRPTAAYLAQTGLDAPPRILEFLERLAKAKDDRLDAPLSVPGALIQTSSNSAKLSLSTISYPALRRCALLPARLLPALRDLHQRDPSDSHPLATLPAAQYSPDLLEASLDAYLFERQADYQAALPGARRDALERFFDRRQDVLQHPQFAPVLALPEAFELPPAEAYIAFEPNGSLSTRSPVNLSLYLKELFLGAVDARPDPALDSSAFQVALQQIRAQTLDTPDQTALSIDAALQELELEQQSDPHPWQRIRDAWRQTFARQDLMEQTILNYTLEALQAAKLELAQLNSQLSSNDFEARQTMEAARAGASALKQAAKTPAPPKEWVVISKQSSKVPPSDP